MVKTLVCGDVVGNWEVVVARVQKLQKSAHGPFDCLFFIGKTFDTVKEAEIILSLHHFPLQTYIFSDLSLDISSVPQNVKLLQSNELLTVQNLTVTMYRKSMLKTSSTIPDAYKASTSSGAYRGCDFFFSDVWPRDMHQFLCQRYGELLIYHLNAAS